MAEIRVFQLGTTTSAIAVRGELDAGAAAQVCDEIALHTRNGTVVVDLLHVHGADAPALELLVPHLADDAVIVVAERRLVADVQVRLTPTLAAALP